MAHKKQGGSTQNGRDSIAKRLGVKLFDGQFASAGSIIVRQRGTRIHPGTNVKRAADDTLFATKSGLVQFKSKKVRLHTGRLKQRKFVHINDASASA